jgi:hypothetical protein
MFFCREKKLPQTPAKDPHHTIAVTGASTPSSLGQSQVNFWQNMEDAKKEIEEANWKKTDVSQAPVEELKPSKMEVSEVKEEPEVMRGNNNGILSVGGQKFLDQSTLFYQFWNQAKWKQTPLYEFEVPKK